MNRRHSQVGLSLIELMVSITVGLILLAGVTRIFLNSKQGYRVQESAARLQENGRYAVETLSRSIRSADFWGGVKPSLVTNETGGALATGTTCADAGWRNNPNDGVHGYAGGTAPPTALSCVDSTSYVANSDMLVLRYADPDAWSAASGACTSGNYYLKALIGKKAALFDGANCASANTLIPGEATNGVLNYGYRFQVFWLRSCSSTPCGSTADGGNPIPSLVAYDSAYGQNNVIAEGIEMLKFEYGVDTNGDKMIDRYYSAADVADWSTVLTVRVSMIVRGDTLDSFTDSNSYDMTTSYTGYTGYTYTPTNVAPTFAQRHQRRLLVKELQIRNRSRQG